MGILLIPIILIPLLIILTILWVSWMNVLWWLKFKTKRTPDFTNKVIYKIHQFKTIWITGASSGIGRELSLQFARLGANLILSSRNEKELEKLKSECANPERVTVFKLDVSQAQQVFDQTVQFVKSLEVRNQKIDILVENAGISQRTDFIDTRLEDHLYLTNVNYNGPIAHVKGVLSHFSKNQSGQIVIISSICGKLGVGCRSSYCGSKHAITGFFDSVRAELKNMGASVTQIFPGYVSTNISINSIAENGKKLAKTDKNIAKGEDVTKFVKKAIFSIAHKDKEVIISRTPLHHFGVALRNVLPSLSFMGMQSNYHNQKDAIDQL